MNSLEYETNPDSTTEYFHYSDAFGSISPINGNFIKKIIQNPNSPNEVEYEFSDGQIYMPIFKKVSESGGSKKHKNKRNSKLKKTKRNAKNSRMKR